MRLTDLQIRKLKVPKSGQKTYFDDTLSGFGIRISQGGTKSFVVMHGPRRLLKTIGRYPGTTLADARLEAKRIQSDREVITKGRNAPVAIKGFEEAKIMFLRNAETRLKPSTVAEYKRLLQKHFAFSKPITEVTRSDIRLVIESLAGSPSEAHHTFVAIRTMMNWCYKHEIIDSSPVPPLSFPKRSRSRILNDEELKLVWKRAIEIGYPFGDFIRLLILTGQRKGEIANLRKSWVIDDQIVFPEGFTKNKREHRLPISPMVKNILDGISTETDLYFPSRGREHVIMSGWTKFKETLDYPNKDQPPIVEGYTMHDLRRTFASNMARQGTPIHVTEKILNHVSGTFSGIVAVYNRYSYKAEMEEALNQHEAFLKKL